MRKSRNLIVLIILLSLLLLSGCGIKVGVEIYTYDDSNYSIGNKAFTEQINEITIDWIAGNVFIEKSTNHELIIREETDVNIEDKYKMHYLLDNNKLDIKFVASNKMLDYKFKVKNLYIFLPCEINDIEVNIVSADLEIKQSIIKDLEINNVSGEINIDSSTINIIEINNVSGDILLFNSRCEEVEIQTVSGNIGLSYLENPKELSVESTSGDITFYIKENDSVGVEYNTVSGDFNSNINHKVINDKIEYNDPQLYYEIDTISGDLTINKK